MNVCQFSTTFKRTNNANNAIQYVKLGKKRRESSKCNYYNIYPWVIIQAIIIKATSSSLQLLVFFDFPSNNALKWPGSARGLERSLEWSRHNCIFPAQTCRNIKLNAVYFLKQNGSKICSLRDTLFDPFLYYTPGLASFFPLPWNFSNRASFPLIFFVSACFPPDYFAAPGLWVSMISKKRFNTFMSQNRQQVRRQVRNWFTIYLILVSILKSLEMIIGNSECNSNARRTKFSDANRRTVLNAPFKTQWVFKIKERFQVMSE